MNSNRKFTHVTGTHAHRGDLHTSINNLNDNRRQRFPRPLILTSDDDHIGRNIY
jgi:hypothetical protein